MSACVPNVFCSMCSIYHEMNCHARHSIAERCADFCDQIVHPKHIREYWEILRDLTALTNRIYCNSQRGALVNRFPVKKTPIGWREFPTIF